MTQVGISSSSGLAAAGGPCWDSGGRPPNMAATLIGAIWPSLCRCRSCLSLVSVSMVWAFRLATSLARRRPSHRSSAGCLRRSFIFATRMVTHLSSSLCLMMHLTHISSARCLHGELPPPVLQRPAGASRLQSNTLVGRVDELGSSSSPLGSACNTPRCAAGRCRRRRGGWCGGARRFFPPAAPAASAAPCARRRRRSRSRPSRA